MVQGTLQSGLSRVLTRLPGLSCIMTAAHDRDRAGLLVRWVMQCASEPVYLAVACERGHPIAPLIRDSHAFAVCIIDEADRLLARKFEPGSRRAESNGNGCDVAGPRASRLMAGDPFDSFRVGRLVTGAPILERAAAAFDCEVVRHFDLEADHEMYVGHVVGACVAGIGGCTGLEVVHAEPRLGGDGPPSGDFAVGK